MVNFFSFIYNELKWMFKINWQIIDSNYIKLDHKSHGRRGYIVHTWKHVVTKEIRSACEKF